MHESRSSTKDRGRKGPVHKASESMLGQLCDDASDTALIENNGSYSKMGYYPFLDQLLCFQ